MRFEYYNAQMDSIIGLTDNYRIDRDLFSVNESVVSMLWNRNDDPVKLVIDNEPFLLLSNQIVTVTYLQNIGFEMGCPP